MGLVGGDWMSEAVIVSLISSGAAAALVSFLNNIIMRRLDRRDSLRAGMMTILFDRIRYLGNAYLEDGAVDFDDRRNLHKMHEVYKQLGGNGDLNVLMDEVNKLPRD
ncbi:hypothetical protein LJC34_05470 [Oscillospiraceae bacterium OttesenSCG-928-G22]|nr:hypothetical protein [Oscillospiraceae bacterium OttesenSCG-928-G22]